ncbi:MAG: hypothetical protein CMB48_07070 [Euryarchaeota archaeon]|nr:hypothetical protein [Euryarchaeota archaeon]
MNTKTIMNVLIAILLCASGLASVVSAAGDDGVPEDMHMVTISVDHDEDSEDEITVSVALTWEYPSMMRNMADTPDDRDGTIDAQEASEYAAMLADAGIEELQLAHRSHVWDMNLGGAGGAAADGSEVAWDISTEVTGLEGTTDDNNSWTVSITLGMDMTTDDLPDGTLDMTLGPAGDREGGVTDLPYWQTTVSVDGTDSWCVASITKDDGSALESGFAYRGNDTSNSDQEPDDWYFTVSFEQADCTEDDDKADDDRDGVGNDEDLCPGTADNTVVDEDGCAVDDGTCEAGTDTDGDGVDDCDDTCPDTTGTETDDNGCSAEQLGTDDDDWTFSVTFTVADASFTCDGMTNDSTAQDCMTAAGATLSDVADVKAGHPHEWSWELQVNGVAADDQDAANMALTSQSSFSWVVKCASGASTCGDETVHVVTELAGALEIASGDCVFFDGVTPTFGDAWDDLGQSSRCFSAEGTWTSGDFSVTVPAAGTGDNTTTDPIDDTATTVEAEETPGFGLIAGVSAALGAALIAASRKED